MRQRTAPAPAPALPVPVEVHPREVIGFDEFLATDGPAVALDGYVEGVTRIEDGFNHVSFNHHEGCSRMTTRATCEQVALALCGRLGGWWQREGVTVHVNDADPDVALSCWLLRHPTRVTEAAVSRLVTAESWLDSTSGAIAPFLDDAEAGALAWVFEPCFTMPATPGGGELSGCLAEVSDRLDAHLGGGGGRLADAREYHVTHRSGHVAVVSAMSPLARSRFTGDGIDAYVLVRSQSPGRWHLSVGISDPMTAMDLAIVYATLNALEGISGAQRWSGSDTVGGSPRLTGTELHPELVAAVLSRTLGLG